MTFYDYMVRTYGGQNSPEGDFVADMRHMCDSHGIGCVEFHVGPLNAHYCHDTLRAGLVRAHACKEALEVFERCWQEYIAYEYGKAKSGCGTGRLALEAWEGPFVGPEDLEGLPTRIVAPEGCAFDVMDLDPKRCQTLLAWIDRNLWKKKSFEYGCSSYGLKHILL